ncbi:hypothetical protein BDR26DRAFT_897272 [Obelidium mucronatum]|nr:hypothetical protein BDR26DRAFT_897272 [Obelidium mucronatum]
MPDTATTTAEPETCEIGGVTYNASEFNRADGTRMTVGEVMHKTTGRDPHVFLQQIRDDALAAKLAAATAQLHEIGERRRRTPASPAQFVRFALGLDVEPCAPLDASDPAALGALIGQLRARRLQKSAEIRAQLATDIPEQRALLAELRAEARGQEERGEVVAPRLSAAIAKIEQLLERCADLQRDTAELQQNTAELRARLVANIATMDARLKTLRANAKEEEAKGKTVSRQLRDLIAGIEEEYENRVADLNEINAVWIKLMVK